MTFSGFEGARVTIIFIRLPSSRITLLIKTARIRRVLFLDSKRGPSRKREHRRDPRKTDHTRDDVETYEVWLLSNEILSVKILYFNISPLLYAHLYV